MTAIPEEQLARWVTECLTPILARRQTPFEQFCAISTSVAATSLIYLMGQTWWDQRMSPTSSRGRARDFLRYDSSDTTDGSRNSERIEALASGLLNLQHVSGFGHLVHRLMTADLETCHAEVRVPDFLVGSGRTFRFNPPRGVRGEDYDIELTLPGMIKVPCEIKCKTEQSTPSKSGLIGVLRDVTDQCPRDGPCVGLISLPEPWMRDPAFESIIEEAVNEVFRNSSRLWIACIMVEMYIEVDAQNAGCGRAVLQFQNDRVAGPRLEANLMQSPLQWMYCPSWRSWRARIRSTLRDIPEGAHLVNADWPRRPEP